MDDEKRLVPDAEQRLGAEANSTMPTIATPGGVPTTSPNGTQVASPTTEVAPVSQPVTPGPVTSPGGGGLGRPNAVRPRAASRRKRSNPFMWVFVVLVGIAAGVGVFFWVRGSQTSTTFQGLTVKPSTAQAISLAVSATGQIQANADVTLSFSSGGTVTEVKVKQGDLVKKGQELARIDDTDLQSSVKTAKATLEQQQASFKKVTDGASQKDIDIAQASLKQAQSKYQQTKDGNALPAELSNAQSSIRSAQAQLASAQAKLAQDQQGGSPSDRASAQSGISSAEAQLASAQAKLQKDQAGPDYATVVSAQAKVDQAQASLDKSRSQLQSTVTSAQVTRDQAQNALRTAQDKYSAVYTDNHNGDGSLKDGLKQSQIDSETSAFRALQDAQGTFNKAEAALNDAKVQLDAGLRSAKSQLDDAKASLDKTKAGATPSDIAADQASVASAQASVASGQSNLAKLSGGTATDVASAQAAVDSSNATLNDLLAGPKPNDIAVAQAQVNQAQANYDNTVTKLKNAVIVAPFDGVVLPPVTTSQSTTSAFPVLGQAVAANATIFQLVDNTALHVDVNVGESDIAKVKLGQAVSVNLDAVSGRSFTGKITYISSKSAVSNNVVNYLVTVTLDAGTANTFNDVWGQELAKYFRALQAGLGGGGNNRQGQGQAGGAGAAGGFPGGAAAGGGQIRIPAALASQLGACGYIPNFGPAVEGEQPKVGMTANTTICQSLKAGVLSVPNRAIKTKTESGRRIQYVQVLVDKDTGKIEDRPISTGLVGDTYTEITAGDLKEADAVVLSTTPTNRVTGAAATNVVGGPPGGGGPGR